MEWFGREPELKYSTIGRVAYAVGVGATDLTETLAMYQTMALELGIENAEATAEKWRTIGAEQLNPYACPRTQYRITAVHIKGRSSYRKWLKKTGEKEQSPAPEPTKRQISVHVCN